MGSVYASEFTLGENPLESEGGIQVAGDGIVLIHIQCCSLPCREDLIFQRIYHFPCVALAPVRVPGVDIRDLDICLDKIGAVQLEEDGKIGIGIQKAAVFLP